MKLICSQSSKSIVSLLFSVVCSLSVVSSHLLMTHHWCHATQPTVADWGTREKEPHISVHACSLKYWTSTDSKVVETSASWSCNEIEDRQKKSVEDKGRVLYNHPNLTSVCVTWEVIVKPHQYLLGCNTYKVKNMWFLLMMNIRLTDKAYKNVFISIVNCCLENKWAAHLCHSLHICLEATPPTFVSHSISCFAGTGMFVFEYLPWFFIIWEYRASKK